MFSLLRNLTMAAIAAGGVSLVIGCPGPAYRLREWLDEPAKLSNVRTESHRMDEAVRLSRERLQCNAVLVEDLVAARIRLTEAIALLIQMNTDVPGYMESIALRHPAGDLKESVARNLLARARGILGEDPAEREEVLTRLDDEYTQLFGRPPPPDPFDQSGRDSQP